MSSVAAPSRLDENVSIRLAECIAAGVVLDVVRTHEAVVIGGVRHENPFHFLPDRFSCELKQRRA